MGLRIVFACGVAAAGQHESRVWHTHLVRVRLTLRLRVGVGVRVSPNPNRAEAGGPTVGEADDAHGVGEVLEHLGEG